MTVENLEIKVKATGAKKAATDLYDLAGALDKVQSAAQNAQTGSTATAKSVQRVGTAARQATKHTNGFMSSLMRIAKYRLMRTIIKEITSAFSEGLKNAYAFSDGIATEGHRFAAALDGMSSAGYKMKNQLGSAFISLLAAIAPIINSIISLVVKLADALSQLFAAFSGTSYLKAIDYNKKWADSAGGAGKAAKEWKNQLLGFDEINRLEEPSNGGGGGGGGSSLDPSSMFQDTALSDWAKKIHDNLALIELTASGFLLALGLILTLSGANIPLGLGLIAVGAAGFAHALGEDWSSVDPEIALAVANITAIVGGALLAIGALLTFSGANVPLGIGLMAAGAVAIGSAVAIHWKAIPDTVGTICSEILLALGAAALAVGAILAFSGVGVGIGIALMLIGATSMAAGAAVNWSWAEQAIGKVVSGIGSILAGALEVVGIILCLSGAGIPLGLGLLYAGMKLSHAAFSLNDNALTQAVQQACDTIWGIVDGLFQGIHGWIQNIIDGISGFLSLSSGVGGGNFGGWAADVASVVHRAGGGFVEGGQLFLANEGSAPELIGTMGGRTAVANNDQIVEGIRQGVYEAVSAANSNGNNDVHVHVYLDSREIKAGQNRLNRAMGVG